MACQATKDFAIFWLIWLFDIAAAGRLAKLTANRSIWWFWWRWMVFCSVISYFLNFNIIGSSGLILGWSEFCDPTPSVELEASTISDTKLSGGWQDSSCKSVSSLTCSSILHSSSESKLTMSTSLQVFCFFSLNDQISSKCSAFRHHSCINLYTHNKIDKHAKKPRVQCALQWKESGSYSNTDHLQVN